MLNLNQSVERMAARLYVILGKNLHSIWLYGSIVLDDFRLGWSDIDLLVLTNGPIAEQKAQQLVGLRQTMLETEPDNKYYRSFEGIIADANEYSAGAFSRLVYWGTSGERITDRFQKDIFSAYELAKYGRSVFGVNDRRIFAEPSARDLRKAVRQHYESIRRFGVQTDEKLYSCGWLLDIARCIHTLRYSDVIAKTQAGIWALSEHLFENEEPLKKTLRIRQNPMAYKDRNDVKQWLKGLGSAVQQYADVLERELHSADDTGGRRTEAESKIFREHSRASAANVYKNAGCHETEAVRPAKNKRFRREPEKQKSGGNENEEADYCSDDPVPGHDRRGCVCR